MKADARVAALRRKLAEENAAAIGVTDPANITYLTGFEGVFDEERAHIALITAELAVLFTDGRYVDAARRAADDTGWDVRRATRNVLESAVELLAEIGAPDLSVEDSMSVRQHRSLSERFAGDLRICGPWVEQLRVVKEPAEIDRIEQAQEITDACFEYILPILSEGRTEREIALAIEFFLRREGSEGVAFPAIVASGPNSAFPHAKVTDRAIEPGDFVKMDFGARVGGYCSDMTRTVVVGKAGERQREVYEAVLSANNAGIAAVKAGMAASGVDSVARTELAERGLGDLFSHGLGHGVGLEVHELPGMGPNSTAVLREGNVVTVEPGVYEAGVGGVRIEDLVVVGEHGARVLTRSPKHLIEL